MIPLRVPPRLSPLTITTQIPSSASHFHLSSIKPPISSLLFRPNINSRLYTRHSSVLASVSDEGVGFEEELSKLLDLIPDNMRKELASRDDLSQLIEIVMDLGRTPLARFPAGDFVLSPNPISFRDLQHATSKVGEFAADNRAGISRTLHRISAIRSRNGVIVGLTCRVGRTVTGSADSLRELVKDGASLLLIGPPGVGKTTIIREISRMLANDYKKRVIIVDTSNEIGGDGDIPHPGIGNARRMQVPNSEMQHKVLIEAVENHMPQAIVIDEIGTKLEAMAASTIAQRGIQLVATAHGVTIENLIMNPSLDMLVGGIQSVTLGDEEASRRGGQKTVQERKGPSTFNCAVEIISKSEFRIHQSLEATVDALLSGWTPPVIVCKKKSNGEIETLQNEDRSEFMYGRQAKFTAEEIVGAKNKIVDSYKDSYTVKERVLPNSHGFPLSIRLYVYGISETRVLQAIKKMKMDDIIQLSQDISESDVFLALQSKLKKHPQIHTDAESHNLPIYVTKTSSLDQIIKVIRALVTKQTDEIEEQVVEESISSEKADALEEARLAIEKVVIPNGDPVDLLPRHPHVLSSQIDLIRKYHLKSEKVGKDPDAFIRIFPVHGNAGDAGSAKQYDAFHGFQDYGGPDRQDSTPGGVDRLPFLAD